MAMTIEQLTKMVEALTKRVEELEKLNKRRLVATSSTPTQFVLRSRSSSLRMGARESLRR